MPSISGFLHYGKEAIEENVKNKKNMAVVSMPSISGFLHYTQRKGIYRKKYYVPGKSINALYIGLSSLQNRNL